MLAGLMVKLIYPLQLAQNGRNQLLIDSCYHDHSSPSRVVFLAVAVLLHGRLGLN